MINTLFLVEKLNQNDIIAALGMHQGSVFPYAHKGRARFGI